MIAAGRRGSIILTALIAVAGLVALVVLAIALLVAGGIRASSIGASTGGAVLASGDGTSFVTVDGDGAVQAYAGGRRTSSARAGDGQALSLASIARRTAVGMSSGQVVVYGEGLSATKRLTFDGRAVAVALDGDRVAVAHGYGQYAKSYAVTLLGGDLAVQRESTIPATITAMVFRPGGGLFVGGSSGQVFVTDARGAVICEAQVDGAVTVLRAVPSGAIVGDDGGEVARIGGDCSVAWSVAASTTGIRSLASTSNTIVVGDAVGDLGLLSSSGQVLTSSRVAGSAIRAIVVDGDAALVVPASGAVLRLAPDAARGLPPAVTIAMAVIALGAVVLLVLRIRRRHPGGARIAVRAFRSVWRQRFAYLFVLPALAIIAVFFYYPVVDAVRVSFTDTDLGTGTSQWVGLANYVQVVVADRYFHRGLVNLLVFVVAALVKTFTVPLLCALLVFWLRRARHRAVYRVLLVLPVVVPDLVVTLLWKTIYQPDGGLLNAALDAVGLGSLQRVWLGDEHTALFAVLFVGFPFMNAFAFLVFYGGLLQIDPAVLEAAALDGVGPLRRLVSIEIPLLRPQVGILVLFSLIGAIQSIASVFVLTGGGPNLATYVPALEMYDQIGQGAIAYASTIGVVLAMIILLISSAPRAISALRARRPAR